MLGGTSRSYLSEGCERLSGEGLLALWLVFDFSLESDRGNMIVLIGLCGLRSTFFS